MALNHVPEKPGFLKVRRAVFHPQFLGHGYLNVVDIPAVPEWLKNSVGKSKDQKVLNGFLAQVMVDSVNILLPEDTGDDAIEFARAAEIAPERFFDDDAGPVFFRIP